jgi:hypothetical protein
MAIRSLALDLWEFVSQCLWCLVDRSIHKELAYDMCALGALAFEWREIDLCLIFDSMSIVFVGNSLSSSRVSTLLMVLFIVGFHPWG